MKVHQAFELLVEHDWTDWLRYVPIEPCTQDFLLISAHCVCSDGQYRYRCRLRILADSCKSLIAVERRHVEIQHDILERSGRHVLPCFRCGAVRAACKRHVTIRRSLLISALTLVTKSLARVSSGLGTSRHELLFRIR